MEGRFLPGQHAITKFGRGGFEFAGMSHKGSLLILPSGMRALEAVELEDVTPEAIGCLADEKAAIDFLLIGTGRDLRTISSPLRKWLLNNQMAFDVMTTPAALRTYNVVQHEGRRVAAFFIAVE